MAMIINRLAFGDLMSCTLFSIGALFTGIYHKILLMCFFRVLVLFTEWLLLQVPSYISRSVAGSYDNEAVAIFALIFTFYLYIKVRVFSNGM